MLGAGAGVGEGRHKGKCQGSWKQCWEGGVAGSEREKVPESELRLGWGTVRSPSPVHHQSQHQIEEGHTHQGGNKGKKNCPCPKWKVWGKGQWGMGIRPGSGTINQSHPQKGKKGRRHQGWGSVTSTCRLQPPFGKAGAGTGWVNTEEFGPPKSPTRSQLME